MSDFKNKILCVLPVFGDTKDAKRIEILKKGGYEINSVAFQRDSFSSRLPSTSLVSLGKIEDGNYVKRLFQMMKSARLLRKHIKSCDIVYAINSDLALYSYVCSLGLKKPIILDVADIREIQVSNSIKGTLVRLMDKLVAKKVSLIVVTSNAFITWYYEKRLNLFIKNSFLLENKVDYEIPKGEMNNISTNSKIKIGYFGVLRDNWTINLLLTLLKDYPDKYEVFIAGIDKIDKYNINELSKTIKGFNYLGEYKSPKDLQAIYNKIDIMSIFYPDSNSDGNWHMAKKICRSNRFYESCFFKKPIIAFSFTEDGKEVNKLRIGLTLDDYNITKAISVLNAMITLDNMKTWVANLNILSKDIYLFKDEPLKLREKIIKSIR